MKNERSDSPPEWVFNSFDNIEDVLGFIESNNKKEICSICNGSGKSRSQDLQNDFCNNCDGEGKEPNIVCFDCSESFSLNDLNQDKYNNYICSDCGVQNYCFCSDCGAYVPTSEINCIDLIEVVEGMEIDVSKTLCTDCNTTYKNK